MKILFAASECAPMVKVGGLADVVGSLPKALSKLGLKVGLIIPKYKGLGYSYPEVLPGTNIPVFYIENDKFFSGPVVYPGGQNEFERFAYFSRAVVEFLDTRSFEPEVIHLHDYHVSLVPDILKSEKKKIATLLTIHDLSNQGLTDPGVLDTSLLSSSHLRMIDWDLSDRNVDMLLQGIVGADVINTVSPTYAREIMTKELGMGLDNVLRAREARVFGILNGLDLDEFDPVVDKYLTVNFPPLQSGGKNFLRAFEEAKAGNKKAIQAERGLAVDAARPLFGMVTRLVERKGIDLVLSQIEDLVSRGVQIVILGKGEGRYEEALRRLSGRHPQSISAQFSFDERLARKIYAAADIFLVPSKFEPCGLTQMIAMRYGAVPVVHATGGLADSVESNLTGFTFNDYNDHSFREALDSALEAFGKGKLTPFSINGLKKDFGWEKSAKFYLRLYEKALSYKFGISRGAGGEIRDDWLGGWTILSTLRKERPDETGAKKISNLKSQISNVRPYSLEEEIKVCPFEEGNEMMSPNEVFRTGSGEKDAPGWKTRVVPNKYPILPAHEVIVHSPDHIKDIECFSEEQMDRLIWTYLSRYRHYEDFGYVHIFCNRGAAAAASLKHPHSQLIVLEEPARSTLAAIETAADFYRSYGICPYCDLLRREAGGPRIVYQNNSFVLLTPFSSGWPYELTLIPITHRMSFGNISEVEQKDLARIIHLGIELLTKEINDLSYNFWIHSLPDIFGLEKTSLYYHWHVDLIPRVKELGGVELGLKLMVDDRISPEEAAERLKIHLPAS